MLLMYKKYINKKAGEIQNELNYLLEELEHFIYKGNVERKDQYKRCNYILDRLEHRLKDENDYNQEVICNND